VGNSLVNPASNVTTDQQLHLGASDTAFTGTTNDFAYAHWIRPSGTLVSPVPMNDSGSTPGNYALGVGTLQVHIDDALTLGGNDTMEFPSSIEVLAQGSVIPEPTTLALLAASAGWSLLMLWGRRRRRT
jgi:hypothetical protein